LVLIGSSILCIFRSQLRRAKFLRTPNNEMNYKLVNHLILFQILLVGLFLFKEGFLLSRLEMPNHSKPIETLPKYNQTLLIMIDALRYDFMKWQDGLTLEIPHFINKLPILKTVLSTLPKNSLLLRGLSDPPTTTLQRLMALMTGALPTLVDAGSNFASSSLKEDNLITKLVHQDKRVVVIGDDTWQKLFPNLNESIYYPSFEVWDLHTVDKGVKENLWPALTRKYGLLIAHFLGVDHAGHRYGPGHVEMGEKLVEMNGVLEKVFNSVGNDTLVIVMGGFSSY
jgi:GPI ethanolamine phosphate transferase 3 subunit O